MKQVQVKLYTYKWYRHYGGRNITTNAHTCKANYLLDQENGTHLVELLEDCANYKAGHKIAVHNKDIFFIN